ncbi:Uncharacterized protein GBIM_08908 [Gryllus bimaculatus]|nr:Uncharacterized protein GBIM_08908 [Gryllus bimaculatus]
MSFVSASSPECIDFENEEKEEVSKPLTSLQEILEWEKFVTPFQVESLQMRTEFSVRGSSFHCHSSKSSDWKHLELNTEDVPKTLVCHDMKGGYIEDRYIDGTETPDAYRFFHWAGIDTFVYFSHKLLTIPPPVWITAGHIHGVKVLGTLITEWDEGEVFWNMLLSNEKKRVSCVKKMVEICEKFGFDGYLLNVENKIPENDVPKLVKFVEELQEALHKKLPHSELVWYDSVISNGKLKWQNELNELNKLFVCDLKSQSGRLVVVYAVKGVPCDTPCSERRSAELRLALVLRDSPSAEPRMMWVNDCNGHQVQRTSDGSSWEPFNNKTPQTSWQVWEYSVPVRGHVVEIIAGLPPGCKAALLGWLEITDTGPEEICDMSKNARENH